MSPTLFRLRAIHCLPVLALGLIGLAGCSPVGVTLGVGATAGIAGAQERTVGDAVDDTIIQAKINERWFSHNEAMFQALDLTVVEGRVLITGYVNDPDLRVDAVRLAWQVDGVREVINEIQLGEGEGIRGYARDVRIANELRSKLTFDREVNAINYNIDTVNGVIYLMGIAHDNKELDRVIAHARNIDSVRRVVSYVRLLDQNPAGATIGSASPADPATGGVDSSYVPPQEAVITAEPLAPSPTQN
jgi:osmotically-inducible protein OsmY